jgi:hypothetical protein
MVVTLDDTWPLIHVPVQLTGMVETSQRTLMWTSSIKDTSSRSRLGRIRCSAEPGNPYIGSTTEKAFGTLWRPDVAATIGEMATRALKASWYHKWIKDLRPRPEEYGALVQARKTGSSPFPQAAGALHSDVLNSAALARTFDKYGTYLLPQAFPEGSPTHPCYPTGHGTVGGACITTLKFFFDGGQKIRPLLTGAGRDVNEPAPVPTGTFA